MTHAEIKRLMPHRFPMLLVDAVLSLQPWDRIVGVKCVTASDPCYAHLSDDAPAAAYAYPVSLVLEAFGQTCGVLLNARRAQEGRLGDELALAAGVAQYDVVRDVFPGERLELRATLVKNHPDFAVFDGEVVSDGRQVAVLETVMVAFRPRDTYHPQSSYTQTR